MKKLLLALTLAVSAISFTTLAKEVTPTDSSKASISKTFETVGLDSNGGFKIEDLQAYSCTRVTYTNPYKVCRICCSGSGYTRNCRITCY